MNSLKLLHAYRRRYPDRVRLNCEVFDFQTGRAVDHEVISPTRQRWFVGHVPQGGMWLPLDKERYLLSQERKLARFLRRKLKRWLR